MQRTSHVAGSRAGMLAMCGCRREISAQTRLLTCFTILIVASHLVKYTKKPEKSIAKASLTRSRHCWLLPRFAFIRDSSSERKAKRQTRKTFAFHFFPRYTRANCTIETLFVSHSLVHIARMTFSGLYVTRKMLFNCNELWHAILPTKSLSLTDSITTDLVLRESRYHRAENQHN